MTRLLGVPTWAEPVPVPVVVKYANAAPPRPRTRAVTNPMVSIFLFLNRFTYCSYSIYGLLTGASGSPVAPRRPGDQIRPVDHHVALVQEPREGSSVLPGTRGSLFAARELPWRSSLLRSEEHTSELQSLRHLVCRL